MRRRVAVRADRTFQIGLDGDLDVGRRTIGLVPDIGGYFKNVITFVRPLAITGDERDLALRALDRPGLESGRCSNGAARATIMESDRTRPPCASS
jgi:hypothetical protein